MNSNPHDHLNDPFNNMKKPVEKLIKKLLEAESNGKSIPDEDLMNDPDVFDASKSLYAGMFDILAQTPAHSILAWIREGIMLAYSAKMFDSITSGLKDCENKEDMVNQAKQLNPDGKASERDIMKKAQRDAEDFCDKTFDEICRHALDGQTSRIMYSSGDLTALMRSYNKWLGEYVKLPGDF